MTDENDDKDSLESQTRRDFLKTMADAAAAIVMNKNSAVTLFNKLSTAPINSAVAALGVTPHELAALSTYAQFVDIAKVNTFAHNESFDQSTSEAAKPEKIFYKTASILRGIHEVKLLKELQTQIRESIGDETYDITNRINQMRKNSNDGQTLLNAAREGAGIEIPENLFWLNFHLNGTDLVEEGNVEFIFSKYKTAAKKMLKEIEGLENNDFFDNIIPLLKGIDDNSIDWSEYQSAHERLSDLGSIVFRLSEDARRALPYDNIVKIAKKFGLDNNATYEANKRNIEALVENFDEEAWARDARQFSKMPDTPMHLDPACAPASLFIPDPHGIGAAIYEDPVEKPKQPELPSR